MADETERLIDSVRMGLLAENLINSALGGFLIKKSENEVAALVEKLRAIDPHNANEIARLQSAIEIAERALMWLREAIIEGRQAEAIINDQERNDYGP